MQDSPFFVQLWIVYHNYLCFCNFFTIFLHDQFLNLRSCFRIDRVRYISVLPFRILPAWHRNEFALLSFNNFDVMHGKFIINRNRYDSLHFSFFVNFSNSHICNIHTFFFPCVSNFLHSRSVRMLSCHINVGPFRSAVYGALHDVTLIVSTHNFYLIFAA